MGGTLGPGMGRASVRRGARCLLLAAFAMVLEGCAQGPRDEIAAEPSPGAGGVLLPHEREHVVVRIHTTDGTIFVTSRYAVTDSLVVIEEILRGEKYYPEMNEPHLHGKPGPVPQPPENTILPVRIPIDRVARMERWEEEHPTRTGIASGVVVFVVVIGGFLLWAFSQIRVGAD
jgi:hypothetical protein